MTNPKLIVIDDEPALASFVCEVGNELGYETEAYHQAQTFMQCFRDDADLIILDLFMPDIDGIEVIRFLAAQGCKARLMLMSGYDSGVLHSAQKLSLEHGLRLAGSLAKPFRHSELHKALCLVPDAMKEDGIDYSRPQFTVDELRTAILADQLVVHYQPKIDLHTGNVAGLEALVRWQHPVHGLITPDNFIALAESYNLIDDLTWVVLGKVVRQCALWKERGFQLSVAVNMSASTIMELTLPERMETLIRQYGLESSWLILEVTETALMEELIKSLDILTRLRMKGFHLSIDDFGTGYSSLVQLYRAPFSEIKIDRSFVMDMATDSEAYAIVETVILLGHKLCMKVVAEGIESQENQSRLATMGCDLAQGYHIARPQTIEEVDQWLLQIQKTRASR